MNIIDRITNITSMFPEKIAIEDNKKNEITYSTLLRKADIFARFLCEKNVVRNDVIMLITQKRIEMIACVLGIIKAGATYLIVDSTTPRDKIQFFIEDSKPKVIFSDENCAISDKTYDMVKIYNKQYGRKIKCNRVGEDAMYVVYTSGSNGKQKGVVVEDRNIGNYISSFIKYFKINASDCMIQQSPLYYDGFAEEVFSMLCSGGKIIIPQGVKSYNYRLISKIIDEHKVTIVSTAPLILNELNKMHKFKTVRTFISSGDVLLNNNIDNIIKYADVYNMYGTTETTVCATVYKCKKNMHDIPIGKPLEGYTVNIKNKNNEIGEIVISGKGVSRGDLNISENKERGFCIENNEKVYYTGDYGFEKNNELYILGRRDRQIKIKANKINLNEIEKHISQMKSVSKVACVCKKNNMGENSVVVYFASQSLSEKNVEEYCKRMIPDYINPLIIIKVEEVPITDTGKINYLELEQRDDLNEMELSVDDICKMIVRRISNEEKSEIDLELQLESLDFMRLVVELEDRFNIEFEDGYLDHEKFETIEDVCKYIMEKINEQ